MFRPSYLKEGPGIDKTRRLRPGGTGGGHLCTRVLADVKVNFLFIVCALRRYVRGLARHHGALHGELARDIPNDVWPDFRRAFRQDLRAGFGLVELALLLLGFALLRMATVLAAFLPAVLGMLLCA
ncbi:MAG: hypothetical protein ACLSF2_00430 [Butyricicoccus sp.]